MKEARGREREFFAGTSAYADLKNTGGVPVVNLLRCSHMPTAQLSDPAVSPGAKDNAVHRL
jgi:hypothetical protein